MNLVDSSGWLEYFAEGANADYFAKPIKDTEALIVSVINYYEVFKRVYQLRGEAAAVEAAAWMNQGRIVDVDASLALEAATLSLELKIPMADSLLLATARAGDAILWTQNEHFKDMDGVNYIPKTL
jgi:toxin FitB